MAYSPDVDYRKVARNKALKYGLDPVLFPRQIGVESINYSPAVISGRQASPAGAQGIAQFMPATARGLGINPLHPVEALDAAAKLMAGYVKKYGSYEKALRAYNAGPGNLQASYGFAETNNYVRKILQGHDPGGLSKPRRSSPGRSRTASPSTGGVLSTRTVSTPGAVLAPADTSLISGLLQAPAVEAKSMVPVTAPAPPSGVDALPSAQAVQAPSAPDISHQLAGIGVGAPSIVVPGTKRTVTGPSTTTTSPGRSTGRTLVIGDSLEVGTFPLLKKMLGGKVEGTFVGGKPSSWGIRQLKQRFRSGQFENVVFDMGTNDATAKELRASLKALTQIVGPDTRVYLATLNGPYDTSAKNELLHTYAANHPNVTLIPWHGVSKGGATLPDGIHGGYDKRAQTIAKALGYSASPTRTQPKGEGSFKLTGPNPGRIHPLVLDFGKQVAAVYGRPLVGSDGSGHSYYTKTGSVSEHTTGDAIDIPLSGKALLAAGRAALMAAGWSRKRAMSVKGGLFNVYQTVDGRRVRHQIIFNDYAQVSGSPHTDHLHISAAYR